MKAANVDESELLENHPDAFNHSKINITRTALNYNSVDESYGYVPAEPFSNMVKKQVTQRCTFSFVCLVAAIQSVLPIIKWLPEYKRGYILSDILSGFTVAIFQLPQGMAYGVLASVKPENGMYMAIFPVVIYFLLCTSRHTSIGTFAVIALMVNSAIAKVNSDFHQNIVNVTNSSAVDAPPTNLEIATSLALTVGLWQVFMGIVHLGALSVLLSDELVSGFCMGSACHVATVMISHILGISVNPRSGMLKLVYMYIEIFSKISGANVVTIIISAVAILVLVLVKEQVNDRFKDKLKIPIPIDLIIVILATLFSYLIDFNGKYNVAQMGHIPTGLPEPLPPRPYLILHVLSDSFAIAIVVFVITLSMAKIFAKKHLYTIDANQELIALGCANIFSSFFACFPCSAALARSLIQERSGAKTQVASVVSAGFMLLVMLFLAPLFYTLPKCILSAVILVALKGMFLQVKVFAHAWKLSKLNAMIWLVTMVSTVILDVSYGLLTGLLFSILTILSKTTFPPNSFLGNIEDTELYLDVQRFSKAKEIRGVKIFHFKSALYFLNKDNFKKVLQESVPLTISVSDHINANAVHHIIIDCSSFSYVDLSGYEMILEVTKEYSEVGITVLLAGCSVAMWDTLRMENIASQLGEMAVFPTIHDAVQYCKVL